MSSNIKIYSFFSGSGFLDLGFENSGFQIELVNEYSPSFMFAYQFARESMGISKPTFGYRNIDINDFLSVRSKELKGEISESRRDGSIVGFIGGPPCPDFSIAGKQKGKNGDNGKLSQSYISLILKQKPDFFLFENVKGLWRTAIHREYYDLLKKSLSRHYKLTDRLCNSLEFGAPQDRDRILLFGVSRKLLKEKGLSLDTFSWDKYRKYDLETVKKLPWVETSPFVSNSVTKCPDGIPEELTVQYWFEKNDVEHHPNSNDFFTPRAGLIRMQTIREGDDSKKSYKRLHRWRYSPTVAYGNNEVHLHPYKERRLSAAEAMSLQTLPKEFVLPPSMSLSDKFKTIGNGVPYVLSKGIAMTIYDFFTS